VSAPGSIFSIYGFVSLVPCTCALLGLAYGVLCIVHLGRLALTCMRIWPLFVLLFQLLVLPAIFPCFQVFAHFLSFYHTPFPSTILTLVLVSVTVRQHSFGLALCLSPVSIHSLYPRTILTLYGFLSHTFLTFRRCWGVFTQRSHGLRRYCGRWCI
jgi:hypothetical protein